MSCLAGGRCLVDTEISSNLELFCVIQGTVIRNPKDNLPLTHPYLGHGRRRRGQQAALVELNTVDFLAPLSFSLSFILPIPIFSRDRH